MVGVARPWPSPWDACVTHRQLLRVLQPEGVGLLQPVVVGLWKASSLSGLAHRVPAASDPAPAQGIRGPCLSPWWGLGAQTENRPGDSPDV